MGWETHPLTPARFDDFADVINPNRRTTHCWCLSRRLRAKDIDELGDGSRESTMRALAARRSSSARSTTSRCEHHLPRRPRWSSSAWSDGCGGFGDAAGGHAAGAVGVSRARPWGRGDPGRGSRRPLARASCRRARPRRRPPSRAARRPPHRLLRSWRAARLQPRSPPGRAHRRPAVPGDPSWGMRQTVRMNRQAGGGHAPSATACCLISASRSKMTSTSALGKTWSGPVGA